MRNLRKNKQTMYYALLNKVQPVYKLDENGNIVYSMIDGVQVPVETGEVETVYSKPVKFKGNIATSGDEAKTTEYGVDVSDYDAVLVMLINELPLMETSLIWHTSPIGYKDANKTIIDEKSADYIIKKISPSLNQAKYLLGKVLQHKHYDEVPEEPDEPDIQTFVCLLDENGRLLLDEDNRVILAQR